MLVLNLLFALLQWGQAPVAYEVSFLNAVHHEAQISVHFQELPPKPLQLRMSRSSPGRYVLHEFVKNVYSVRAHDGRGRELEVVRPDAYGWEIDGHDGSVTFTYTLFADHADGTYSGIDLTHAHLNMPATFVWARGLQERPVRVTFQAPPGVNWRAVTQLAPTADPLTFTAADLDYFMDSPTELSDFVLREWSVSDGRGSYTMRVAMHHQGTESELDRYVGWTRRLVEETRAVFDVFPRFDYGAYTFIADYLPWVYGDGMEHRNSTILASSGSLAEAEAGLLGTVAHEFFHAWNVERIRPRSLEPFDFEAVNMSRELWFAEGFTSYYGRLLTRRVGLVDDAGFASGMSDLIATVMLSPGRDYFSAVGMSMQAPFVDEARHVDATNHGNTFISYYTWGAGLALALDLTLRTRFDGIDLDDYMRALWEEYGESETPYTMDDLQSVLARLTGDADFAAAFYRDYVDGQRAPDFEALLARAGFALVKARPGQTTFGWVLLDYGEGGATLRSPTVIGTPLYDAGVDRGDRILQVAGQPLRQPADLRAVMSLHAPGDVVEIEFEQRGHVRRESLTLIENRWLRIAPYEAANLQLTDEMRQLRAAWLGSRVE